MLRALACGQSSLALVLRVAYRSFLYSSTSRPPPSGVTWLSITSANDTPRALRRVYNSIGNLCVQYGCVWLAGSHTV
jgi:hypothetical protein